ncbi:MAG: hypothetical protein K9N05_00705 [Candidatus Marinimicrobia bacterium]|nr:hypothetical protein [Candidatus Neomarinimicrobiota bacterium]
MNMKKITFLLLIILVALSFAGEKKYLQITELSNWFFDHGSELESEGPKDTQVDGLSYPQFRGFQDVQAAKGFWIGCKNFTDPINSLPYDHKVIIDGPRRVDEVGSWMNQEFDLVGQFDQVEVLVNGVPAARHIYTDQVDIIDETLVADRMIHTKINTSLGITVTRDIYAFSHSDHQNYFIYEYTFENTGIYDAAGTTHNLTLNDLIFYWQWRYGCAYEAADYDLSLVTRAAKWGENQMNDWSYPGKDYVGYEGLRAVWSWNGTHSERFTAPYDNLGAPDFKIDGHLASPHFSGTGVVHADKSAIDHSDDPAQPSTYRWLGSNSTVEYDPLEFDPSMMTMRYLHMEDNPSNVAPAIDIPAGEGRGSSHADEVIASGEPADKWTAGGSGGASVGMGFGPYDLAHGQSVKIVLAEAIGTLDWEHRKEVGLNWCKRANFTANSLYTGASGNLPLPGSGFTTDIDAYKRAWVMTGKDSIFQAFQRAIDNYNNGAGYTVPTPPPPPSLFSVLPGGDRIVLEWSDNAEAHPNFAGYRVYRALQEPDSTYHLIYENGGTTGNPLVNTCEDRSAIRGFSYYYYIESYDDGSTGKELASSKFHTMTNESASLQRPASSNLDNIRVVPNPYNRRARSLQYGEGTGDKNKINFYGIPPKCDIMIYSERGEKIKTIVHSFPTGDESWDMKTETNQLVKSGVYIARIVVTEEVLDEETGAVLLALGESTFLKFIIIR